MQRSIEQLKQMLTKLKKDDEISYVVVLSSSK